MQSSGKHQFEAFTMPHVDALFQTAVRLTESPIRAEKLVNEVCDSAFTLFESPVEPAQWRVRLFKILIRQIYRHNGNSADVPSSDSGLNHSPNVGAKQSGDSNRGSYARAQVLSGLARVPLGFRAFILLVDCQGFSYNETADILGLSADAVANGVLRARNCLSAELGVLQSRESQTQGHDIGVGEQTF